MFSQLAMQSSRRPAITIVPLHDCAAWPPQFAGLPSRMHVAAHDALSWATTAVGAREGAPNITRAATRMSRSRMEYSPDGMRLESQGALHDTHVEVRRVNSSAPKRSIA